MSDSVDAGRPRLDSWKTIAQYLKRDVTTVRRWEKLGMPVRRIPGGRGRSVFAYPDEIDAWLATKDGSQTASEPAPPRRLMWPRWAAMGGLTAAAVFMAWQFALARLSADDLRVDVTAEGIKAFDTSGKERWRYAFPASLTVYPLSEQAVVMTGDPPAIYAGTLASENRVDHQGVSGELMEFDLKGHVQRRFSFPDEVTIADKQFGPPWALTGFAIDDSEGRRRIAVTGRHYIWSPSLVTILDDWWRRPSTFIHDGWIESVNWIGHDRLLIGGFAQEQNGGTIALLDGAALDRGPSKIVVIARSEVNRIAVAPFNRAIVQIVGDRIVARAIEVPALAYPSEAIYEFNRSLDIASASFSDRYWEAHRQLEQEGKITHTRERCPDRDGPREVRVWTAATGWTTQVIPHGS